MKEPPDTVVLGCTHFPLLQEELLQVLPEGTRLVDSGAAIARRTAQLLEHEAPDAKSADANIAFCMAMTPEAEQLLPVLQRYGFETLENWQFRLIWLNVARSENYFKFPLVRPE